MPTRLRYGWIRLIFSKTGSAKQGLHSFPDNLTIIHADLAIIRAESHPHGKYLLVTECDLLLSVLLVFIEIIDQQITFFE